MKSHIRLVEQCVSLHEKLHNFDVKLLKKWLIYDESSPSSLRWVSRPCRNVFAGDPAGSIEKSGYWSVTVEGNRTRGHHVVLLLHGRLPAIGQEVDHVDRDKANNQISNLRWVTKTENARNRAGASSKPSNYPYVSWSRKMNKWRVQLQVDKRQFHLGVYDSEQTAHAAALDWLQQRGQPLLSLSIE